MSDFDESNVIQEESVMGRMTHLESIKKNTVGSSDLKVTQSRKMDLESQQTNNLRALQQKMEMMKKDLEGKKRENSALKKQLIDFEIRNNINVNSKKSVILEKDLIKKELQTLTKNLIDKEEELRSLTTYFETLREENEQLQQSYEKLKKEEPIFDQ